MKGEKCPGGQPGGRLCLVLGGGGNHWLPESIIKTPLVFFSRKGSKTHPSERESSLRRPQLFNFHNPAPQKRPAFPLIRHCGPPGTRGCSQLAFLLFVVVILMGGGGLEEGWGLVSMCLVTVTGCGGGADDSDAERRPHRATCEPHDRGADPAAIRTTGSETRPKHSAPPKVTSAWWARGVGLSTELKSSISFLCWRDLWSLEMHPPPLLYCWALLVGHQPPWPDFIAPFVPHVSNAAHVLCPMSRSCWWKR